MKRLLWILFLVLICESARAYPGYIGFGYTSCRTCHFNPLGGGPLTDYGRAVSAAAISGNLFGVDSDDKLVESSGFFGPITPTPSFLALQAKYRGNYLVTNLERNAVKRWIHMQSDASVVLRSPNDRFIASGTLGYAPVPSSVPPSQRANISTVISREHYFGFRPTDELGFYVGLMDQAYGLRVPDHNAFIRSRTFRNMNDQTHGVLVHYANKDWDVALHAVLGNLTQESQVRQKGASLFFEKELGERVRAGLSFLATAGSLRTRQMAGLHTRIGLSEGSSVTAELTLMRETLHGSGRTLGDAFFVQTMSRLARGLYWLQTFEHYTEDLYQEGPRYFRVGPGLLYAPFQRLELRVDFQATRPFGSSTVDQDSYTLMSQVHLWL